MGPEWSSREPRLPTLMDRSERSMFSPKKSKKMRPTGDLRNAVPPWWPGVCQEYSKSSVNFIIAAASGGIMTSR